MSREDWARSLAQERHDQLMADEEEAAWWPDEDEGYERWRDQQDGWKEKGL
ncbi:MAG: hypothetical protein E7K79_04110 [Actinomyces urogenitalis]|nr:hypothetical protein [Actinomyces urogenitalis]